MEKDRKYTVVELMACTASKLIEDRKSILVGTGLPILAAVLAQKTHAPNLLIVFEAGGIGAEISMLPVSVGDSRTFHKAIMASSMDYVMASAQVGHIDYCFLGCAQIDPYGNINTTVIGSHERPKVRLPGSGGANDAGSLCWRTIVMMKQDKQRFVKNLDFLTTPGYLSGIGAREKAGLPSCTGPYRVVTQLGIMGFDEKSGRMTLLSLHPEITVDQIVTNTGFELLIPDNINVTEPPTENELKILREEIDPTGKVSRQ